MDPRFDPEAIDLASVRNALELGCGSFIEGEVVGRTRLRDEVARHTGSSLLDAERIVDTMIARGFLRKEHLPDGRTGWSTVAVH
jgi:hypothetical protein